MLCLKVFSSCSHSLHRDAGEEEVVHRPTLLETTHHGQNPDQDPYLVQCHGHDPGQGHDHLPDLGVKG